MRFRKRLEVLLISLLVASSALANEEGFVIGWGANGDKQAVAPAGLDEVIAVAAGGAHSVALKNDGTVVAWGYNSNGQTNVPTWLSNVVSIAAFNTFTVALRKDGTIVSSSDPYGQGGFRVIPGVTNAIAIAVGAAHIIALRSDSTVFAWGDNTYGQLSVPAGLSNVVSIAAGYWHSLALKSDGTVVFWGLDHNGLGSIPVGLSNVTAIAAGYLHNLALKQDGTIAAWGAGTLVASPPDGNNYGQSMVPPGLSNVVSIAAGGYNSAVVKSDGTLTVWGDYLAGQTNVPSPLVHPLSLAVGDEFVLTVLRPSPPVILQGPTNIAVREGGFVKISCQAFAAPLPSYQWQMNGNYLANGTNATITFYPLAGTNAGRYAIVISNQVQSTTTAEAVLTVIPVLRPPAFDRTNLVVRWSDPFVLQTSTSSVAGPYVDLTGATSPYTNLINYPQQFFRLRN